MKRVLATLAVCAMACVSVRASEAHRVLFDFEGSDMATIGSVQRSAKQAKTGGASGMWANHPTAPHAVSKDIPHDWSAFDTLSLWLYSPAPVAANLMLVLHSENESTSGPDYFWEAIKVDWECWRRLEFPFDELATARSPIGWTQIDDFGLHASGWGNEPIPGAEFYIDDVRLVNYGSTLRNPSFDFDTDGDGVPDYWKFSPQGKDATGQVTYEDGGRTGKCVKIVDKQSERGFGLMQYVPADPGKTYKLTAWKKGDPIVYYLNFCDANRKRIGREHTKTMRNKDTNAWEEFTFSSAAPEGTKSVRVWIYSPSSNLGTFYIDDATLEVTD